MTESELLNEICCQQIYPTYLGIENEILNLLESLYEEDYIQKDDGCYKITTKGKQRIVYEFLVYQAENNNFFDQSIQDYFFEDNREWFNNRHILEQSYSRIKKQLRDLQLIEMEDPCFIIIFDENFEDHYNSHNNNSIQILNFGNLINNGNNNEINN